MNYTKDPISLDEQLSLIKKRGLNFSNTELVKFYLQRISYFRLAQYWKPMESDKVNHIFKSNSKFEDVLQMYNFDKCLRKYIFNAIQDLEIALRTQMIHTFVGGGGTHLHGWKINYSPDISC